jgi:hypothetical protein
MVDHHLPVMGVRYIRSGCADQRTKYPVAWRAPPPDSGGELRIELPSSDEEGWRSESRGGAELFVSEAPSDLSALRVESR